MVSLIDPFDKLKKELEIVKGNSGKLNKIAEQGFITEELRAYAEQLLIMDYLSKEVAVYTQLKEFEHAAHSCVEIRIHLDSVSSIYFTKVIKGHPNSEYYKELYSFARQKYDGSVQMLESVAETI